MLTFTGLSLCFWDMSENPQQDARCGERSGQAALLESAGHAEPAAFWMQIPAHFPLWPNPEPPHTISSEMSNNSFYSLVCNSRQGCSVSKNPSKVFHISFSIILLHFLKQWFIPTTLHKIFLRGLFSEQDDQDIAPYWESTSSFSHCSKKWCRKH